MIVAMRAIRRATSVLTLAAVAACSGNSSQTQPSAGADTLGAAYLRRGQLTQAYDALLDANRRTNTNARLNIATIDVMLARREQARDQAFALLNSDSLRGTALTLLAATASTPEQIRKAIKDFETSLPQLGRDTRARLSLGSLYWRNRDTVSARRVLEEALSADANSFVGHLVLSRFYTAMGAPPLAQREIAKATELVAQGSPNRLEAIDDLVLLGQRDQATEVLTEVAEKNPADLTAPRLAANIALSDGRIDEAAKSIAQLTRLDSADVEGLVLSGRLNLARRQNDAAIADFQRALKQAPDVAPIHYYLAAALLQSGKTNEAKAELSAAVALEHGYHEAVFQLAEINLREGAPEAARAALDRFIAANPKSVKARVLLGAALSATGHPTEATEAFQQILSIDPNSSEGHYWIGMGLVGERRMDEARDQFEAALSLSPEFREAITQLVLMDLTQNAPDLAISRIRRQLSVVPRSADLYDLLGLAHATKGQTDSAEAAFLKSVELNPSLLDPHVRLSELYTAMAQPDRALAQAEAATSIDPRNVRGLMALGVAAQQKGDLAKAARAYETALQLEPRFAGPANNLALLLANRGDDASALKFALRAQELAPEDPHIMDTVGWIQFKRGDYDRAVKNLTESARQLPQSPSIQYHLGMAAQKAGNTALAREALEKALGSATGFPEKEDARKALLLLK